jgi:flagellar biosynthesis component FlhA
MQISVAQQGAGRPARHARRPGAHGSSRAALFVSRPVLSEAALEPFIPKIVVISPSEIPPMTQVQSLGSVR